MVGSTGSRSRSRQLRPRRPVTYVEEELEPLDNIIFCGPCGAAKSGGCDIHPPVFANFRDFDLRVEKSHIKEAGDGVVNHGTTIPEGVLFGPYAGKFVSAKDYKKKGKESGMAWKITKPDGPGVLGYVDPGTDITGKQYWMAKVNCTGNSASQNLVGFQFRQKI